MSSRNLSTGRSDLPATAETLSRHPDVHVTELDGELFLVSSDDTEIFYLDRLGAGLWNFLERPRTRSEIHAVFADAFPEITAGQLRADLDTAIARLLDSGLIQEDG